MSTILLTGAHGMLGRRLAEALAPEHTLVSSTRRGAEGTRALDLLDAEAVEALVGELRPDWIVNAAAYTAVDQAESEREAAHAANAGVPGCLARAAASVGARLLHFSTDFVFSGESEGQHHEGSAIGPRGVYAETKAAGESAVREALPDDHLIVRVSWLFGPDGGNFVSTMWRLAADRERLTVVDDQHGTPTYTRDAAAAAALMIAADLRGTVHCANQGSTTWCGLAREAIALRGLACEVAPIRTEDWPTPAPRPRNSALENRRLRETIGDPMRPWREALAAYEAETRAESGSASP